MNMISQLFPPCQIVNPYNSVYYKVLQPISILEFCVDLSPIIRRGIICYSEFLFNNRNLHYLFLKKHSFEKVFQLLKKETLYEYGQTNIILINKKKINEMYEISNYWLLMKFVAQFSNIS